MKTKQKTQKIVRVWWTTALDQRLWMQILDGITRSLKEDKQRSQRLWQTTVQMLDKITRSTKKINIEIRDCGGQLCRD